MSRIHILPEHEARKIAAGEVVERPASVVKELLENALDAQASEIRIVVKDGGKASLMVSDTGVGMSPEDARLCVEHHATSKITSVDQLSTLQTFGFRGEALSSIASVSNMKLITRQREDAHACELRLVAGKMVYEAPAAANVGTSIVVENLFFNVPARRAFLKQRDTEWRAIQQLVTAYALAFPHIGFTLVHDEQVALNLAPCATIFHRAEQLFIGNEHEQLIAVPSVTHRDMTITGYASTAAFTRYDRRFLMSFVNRRWVKNHALIKAIINGYQNSLAPGKYPHVALALTLPTEQIDVNIHPRKEEVLLLHPYVISDLIESTLARALNERVAQPLLVSTPTSPVVPPVRNAPAWQDAGLYQVVEKSSISGPSKALAPAIVSPQGIEIESVNPDVKVIPAYTFLGVLHATYLLIETDEGLLVLDQHAAHERIIFDQLQQKNSIAEPTALLFPEFIPLGESDYIIAVQLIPQLELLGMKAEPWGTHQLMITATSMHLKQVTLVDIVMKLVTAWHAERPGSPMQQLSESIYYDIRALIACKAAIKAGDVITTAEVHGLISAYLKTANRMTCPHGRPTSWLITSTQLERTFKRSV